MKFDGNRIALGLMLAVWLFQPLKTSAVQANAYSLCYAADSARPYSYITPFTVSHTILKPDGSQFFSGSSAPQVFQLLDSGEGSRSIAAYCADASAGIQPGARYRRINLEDSSYFSDTTAGKLRAVLRSSYPVSAPEAIEERANTWLRALELPEISGLQSGEAILAAQIAIWKLTNGSCYTVHSLCSGTIPLDSYEASVIHRAELSQQGTSRSAQNIESLYTYFVNLEPASPTGQLITDAVVPRTVYSCVQLPDGSYMATVHVTVSMNPGEGDVLTLNAACGGQLQSKPVLTAGEYIFTFEGLDRRAPVELTITGSQYGSDVYLFDAEGDRDASQTLIGWDSGSLPVCWERTITPLPD